MPTIVPPVIAAAELSVFVATAVAILLNYSADKAATLGAAFYESIP